MQVHTVAYATLDTSTAGLTALPAVQDQFFSSLGGSAFLLPAQFKLVSAFAIGPSLSRARVNSPSLLRVGYPYIRPIQQSLLSPNDPNIMVLHQNQLYLPPGEPVGVDAITANGDFGITLLWFCHEDAPLPDAELAISSPQQESFWLRYTAPTINASGNSIVLPLSWSLLTPAFDQTVPSGTYEVIGFEHAGPTAVGARLNFPGRVCRPGTVATPSVNFRTCEIFYNGSFGALGTFQTISPPAIEVLCTAGDTGQHEGYLRVARVGDLTAQQTRGPHRGMAGIGASSSGANSNVPSGTDVATNNGPPSTMPQNQSSTQATQGPPLAGRARSIT
jgi:hypothetical protein